MLADDEEIIGIYGDKDYSGQNPYFHSLGFIVWKRPKNWQDLKLHKYTLSEEYSTLAKLYSYHFAMNSEGTFSILNFYFKHYKILTYFVLKSMGILELELIIKY